MSEIHSVNIIFDNYSFRTETTFENIPEFSEKKLILLMKKKIDLELNFKLLNENKSIPIQ